MTKCDPGLGELLEEIDWHERGGCATCERRARKRSALARTLKRGAIAAAVLGSGGIVWFALALATMRFAPVGPR